MNAELQVESTLPVLSFNFEQLKGWAKGLTERYADLVVTEDAVIEVKKDMAELNKARKAVDDARKETVRRISEPIRAFEEQIKEVCGIFESTYAALGAQVKQFEDAQREEKRNKVLELIGECFAEKFGAYEEWPDLDIPVQDKWLNKTTSLKSIREDVLAIIDRHVEDERRRVALEQARTDRIAAIERHVASMNQQYGMRVPVARFLTQRWIDGAQPLSEILEAITSEFIRASQAKPKDAAPPPMIQAAPASVHESSPTRIRAMSIVIEYDAANEARVQSSLAHLKAQCISYAARVRQE